MANKRILKKAIRELTAELAGECFAYAYFHEDADIEKTNNVLLAVCHTGKELISRINRGIMDKDRKSVKAHYSSIISDAKKMPDLLKFE